MKAKNKFYVVWQGRTPGIYDNWDEAARQIHGFSGARFKAFRTRAEAETAYEHPNAADPEKRYDPSAVQHSGTPAEFDLPAATASRVPVRNGIAVDASCRGVPGPMEYQAVWLASGEQAFHAGPWEDGTNNIGEFLAIVHAAAMLKGRGLTLIPIYSDSRNAISWTLAKVCRTKLQRTPRNERIFELIARAVLWLKSNTIENPVLKWETEVWGENPADFGRK